MVVQIEADQLTLAYDRDPVVSEVSFKVSAGELVAIIGPNGVGKSTVINGLAGLMVPRHGRVLVQGQDIAGMAEGQRAKRIAVLPQTLRYLRGITVADFVTQGRYIHRPSWQRIGPNDKSAIERALVASELADLRNRPMDQLSGGERQRCVLARALAQESEILLVDEPTSALDARHQLWAFKRLAELAHSGRTVVVVTHDLNLASQFSSRIIYFSGGTIKADGTVSEVLKPELLQGLLGGEYLTGMAKSGSRNEPRPWFIPWWHGEDHGPGGQHPAGQDPVGE